MYQRVVLSPSPQVATSRKRSSSAVEDETEEEQGSRKEKRKPGRHVTVKEEKKDSNEVEVEVSEQFASLLCCSGPCPSLGRRSISLKAFARCSSIGGFGGGCNCGHKEYRAIQSECIGSVHLKGNSVLSEYKCLLVRLCFGSSKGC